MLRVDDCAPLFGVFELAFLTIITNWKLYLTFLTIYFIKTIMWVKSWLKFFIFFSQIVSVEWKRFFRLYKELVLICLNREPEVRILYVSFPNVLDIVSLVFTIQKNPQIMLIFWLSLDPMYTEYVHTLNSKYPLRFVRHRGFPLVLGHRSLFLHRCLLLLFIHDILLYREVWNLNSKMISACWWFLERGKKKDNARQREDERRECRVNEYKNCGRHFTCELLLFRWLR